MTCHFYIKVRFCFRYSSPSAGLASKDTSPYGSKIGGKGEGDGQNDQSGAEDEGERGTNDDNGSKVTVIQIIPATLNNGTVDLSVENVARRDIPEEAVSSVDEEDGEDLGYHLGSSAVQEQRRLQQQRQRSSSPPHRELPRVTSNGVSNRSNTQPRRRLPERTGPLHPLLQTDFSTLPRMSVNSNNAGLIPTFSGNLSRRGFRSNLPRPSPMGHFSYSRVPLPPVPELERSDHERESISPTPSASLQEKMNESSRPANENSISPLPIPPAPKTINIPPPLPAIRANLPLSQHESRIPRSSLSQNYRQTRGVILKEPEVTQEEDEIEAVDLKLKSLLAMLNARRDVDGSVNYDSDLPKEDTLKYLSQLEDMAKRLKDQLLMEKPKVNW